MINEYQTFRSSIEEATHRIDGKAMLFCSVISIALVFMSFLEAIDLIPDSSLGKKWVFWCFMPLVQFGLYVQYRQFSSSEDKVYEVVSAVLLIAALVAAIVLFY